MELFDGVFFLRPALPAGAAFCMRSFRRGHSRAFARARQAVVMGVVAALLAVAGMHGGPARAAATAYYVLDPDFSLDEATVVSLEDGNIINAGNTRLYLDRGETGIIPAADLAQGTRVFASGAFSIGNSVNGTDLPNPQGFAGTLFSIAHRSNSHRYLLLSPETAAQAMISLDGENRRIALAPGEVYTLDMGTENGSNKLGVITSDVPVLVQHKGYYHDDARYSYPVPPAATELWGFRSRRILVAAAGTRAHVQLHASSGDAQAVKLNGREWKDPGVGNNDSEGRGDAVHVVADRPVSAVQFDDGDGREATAFFAGDQLATHFALPVDAQYVAVLCTQPNTLITLYEAGYPPDERSCNPGGATPGKVYFGSSSDGVHMRAGSMIEATRPVYLVYEDARSNDEKNLLGFDLRGPMLSVVNPGEQAHLETRNVLLQVKAVSRGTDPLVYAANGLPPGLAIDADTGLVSGQLPRGSAGSYPVVITVDDGVSSASVSFPWVIGGGYVGVETLIRSADAWKYLDDGSDQGSAWRDPAADDSAWPEGVSQFGFGEGDEATYINYGADPAHKFITSYFRKDFVLADSRLVRELALRLMRDDGAVVYLNGHEVVRSNMANGSIGYRQHASERVHKTDDRDENRIENIFLDYRIDPAWLLDGVNVLAVEVHLYDDDSSDMSFDLELSAGIDLVEDNVPPGSIDLARVSFGTKWGHTVIRGKAGAAEAFARITIETASGETLAAVANADGSFRISLNTDTGRNVSITLADRHGNAGETVNVTAVGSTAGSFDVSPQGAATYSIPLTVPPGIAAMQPALSLAYNSQAGDGLLGPGWSLQGLSAISRCAASLAQDGFIDGVDFDANDRFCLDGQRLIAVNGAYGGNATEYRTEIDSFSKIVSYTQAGTRGVAHFRVWTRSGRRLDYGASADSRIEASNRKDKAVLVWAVNRIEDTVGNYLTATYAENTRTGEYYPLRIDYTGNDRAGVAPLASVSFAYSGKPAIEGYLAGSSIASTRLMSGVDTHVGPALVRRYHLGYRAGQATGRKRLVSVQECSPDACLPASVFAWQDMAGADLDATILVSTHDGTGFDTRASWADVNGDGFADWVRAGVADTQVRLGNGDGTFANLIVSAHGESSEGEGVAWADVNGDGLADWVRGGFDRAKVRLSNGDGSFGALLESPHGESYQDAHVGWADINGDGLPDWVRAGSDRTKARLSLGDGRFGPMLESVHGDSSQHSGVSWVDINGDGLADWVRGGFDRARVRLSNGDGSFGAMIESPHGESYQDAHVAWADINGDGLPDWVRAGSDRTKARLSLGDGRFGPMVESVHGASAQAIDVTWADINGDGMADWLRAGSDRALVRLSNGDGSFGQMTVLPHGVANWNHGVAWLDVNGDGLTDWVRAGYSEIQARLHTGVRPDLIHTLSSGAGVQVTLAHRPLTDNAVYTKHSDSSFPVVDVVAPLYVVSSSATADGIGGLYRASYRYAGLKLDLSGRGLLGFAETTVTDGQTGMVTQTRYAQAFPQTGRVLGVATRLDDKVLTETVNALDSFTTAAEAVYFPFVAGSTEKTYELPGGAPNLVTTVTVENVYAPRDRPWGDVSRVSVATEGGGERRVTVTTNAYQAADPVNWILGRLQTTAVSHSLDGGMAEVRTTAFEYDAVTGLLTAEIVAPGDAQLQLRTEYVHDVFGRTAITTLRDSGAATHAIAARSSGSSYTPAGAADPARPYDARLEETNALGHSETRWIDTRYGVVTSQTGPNGLSTYWRHDDFGRKVLEERGDGSWTRWRYSWCGAHCADGGTAVTVEDSGAAPLGTYADLLGREVRTATRGLDGTPIYQDTQYNSRGQVSARSRPYYRGNSRYWTTYFYDTLGRVKEEHSPDGGRMQTSYNGLSTTVRRHDLAGSYDQRVTRISNVQGKLKAMIDAGQARTVYDYDPAGNLVKVTDAAGNISTMEYDDRDRKTGMNDPDMGAWSYRYDALGQLRRQTDAKRQVVEMEYDPLGRMLSRSEVEGLSRWSYDAAANGIGKPASVIHDANGYEKTFAYDRLGRLSAVTSRIDAEVFTMGYAYDSAGRRERITYPTGFAVRNIHAASGQLLEVRNAANDQVYWTAESVDAAGKVTEAFLGNGLQTRYVHDGASGHLREINTGTVFGSGVQDLAYRFDPLGNLVERRDDNQHILGQPLQETFAYDSRNRLLSATIAGAGSRRYGYDDLGNIRQKSDYGDDYSYGSGAAGPHAVTGVKLGGVARAAYAYDANGNMTGGAGRAIAWTSFNKPARITKGATTLRFGYDAEHNRIRQVNGDHTTYYLSPRIDAGAHYEKEINGALIGHKHYIYAGGQSIALYTMQSDGTDKTRYLHKDHLGSTDVITDEKGNVVERMSFEAFGSRRNTDWSTPTGLIEAQETHHGFTGHEHLDDVGIIHMNGRLYDPQLGRFLSPDIQVQYPQNSQSFNRYSYVHNNPLSYSDPSGYGFFSKLWKGVKNLFKNKVVRVIVALIAGAFTYGAVWTALGSGGGFVWGGSMAIGALSGAAGGFVGGGILTGSLAGAVKGAVSGALFAAVGSVYGNTWNAQRVAANSLAGGLSSEIHGRRFVEGLKISLAVSVLAYSNYRMRLYEKGIVKKYSPYNADKDSDGFFEDATGMAGARRSFENGMPLPCDSWAGGCQGAAGLHPGDVGSHLGPFSYAKGSVLEKLAESFSGPHDWLRDFVSRSYLANGDAVNYQTLPGKMYDTITNYALVPVAGPFAAGALVGVSPGAVNSLVIYDSERR